MFRRMTGVLVLTAVLGGGSPAQEKPYPFGAKVAGTGKPMILIPGLGCDGSVWDSTVEHFKGRFACHVLTPAGFAGQRPVPGPFFDTLSAGIARYVKDKNLDKPAVVGHSIAASVALKAAADHPDLIGAVVAVDGFPCLFAVIDPAVTADAMRKLGEAERAKLERATKEEFLKAQRTMLTPMLSGDRLEGVMKWQADSDRLTVAKAKGEYFALDLRPEVPKIAAPILVAAAYNPAAYDRFQVTKAAFEERVKAQVAKAKAGTVGVHGDCKHFVMYDRPDWLWAERDRFPK